MVWYKKRILMQQSHSEVRMSTKSPNIFGVEVVKVILKPIDSLETVLVNLSKRISGLILAQHPEVVSQKSSVNH